MPISDTFASSWQGQPLRLDRNRFEIHNKVFFFFVRIPIGKNVDFKILFADENVDFHKIG